MAAGYGFVLAVAAVVTTVLFVVVADTLRGWKTAVVAACIGTFLLPRWVPAVSILMGPAQAVLSALIILYLRFQSSAESLRRRAGRWR
jgi:hypothetical protein